jgi:arginine/ornithine N-succinyltransferase beta subunit
MGYTTGSHLEHLNQPKRQLNLRISVKKCFSNNDRQPRMQIFIFILHNEDTDKITAICAIQWISCMHTIALLARKA